MMLGVSGQLPKLAVPSGKGVTLGCVSTLLHRAPQRGLCSGRLELSHWRLPFPVSLFPPSLLLSPRVAPSSSICVRTLVSGSAWETPTLRQDEMTRRQSVAGT